MTNFCAVRTYVERLVTVSVDLKGSTEFLVSRSRIFVCSLIISAAALITLGLSLVEECKSQRRSGCCQEIFIKMSFFIRRSFLCSLVSLVIAPFQQTFPDCKIITCSGVMYLKT